MVVTNAWNRPPSLKVGERERERVRKGSRREVKRKHLGGSERCLISEGEERASC
jgi:hypothetical protein